jgi:hypothetical protein
MNDSFENTQLVEFETEDRNHKTGTSACCNDDIDTSNSNTDSNVLNAAWTIRTMLNQMVASPTTSTLASISSPQKTIDDGDDSGIPFRVNKSRRHSDLPSSSSHPKDYFERLKTFTIMEYFAKPIHLSPIVCAITGWELQQKQRSTTSTTKRLKNAPRVNRNNTNIPSLSENMNDPTSSFIDSVSRLVCSCCRVVLIIYLPQSILSKESTDSLIIQYQKQLYEKHELFCKYRTSAEYVINTSLVQYNTMNNSKVNSDIASNNMQHYQSKLIVPTILSRAIQQRITGTCKNNISSSIMLSSLELVEQISPWWIIVLKFKQLFPHIINVLVQNPSINIVVPDHILYYDKDSNSGNNEATKANDTTSNLFNRLVSMLKHRNDTTDGDKDDTNNISAVDTLIELPTASSSIEWKAAEITMAILITGWDLKTLDMYTNVTPPDPNYNATGAHTSIHCIFCLSCQPIIPTLKPSFDNVEILELLHSKKRQRSTTTATLYSEWNQPYIAHRYYCPWVCGFPITTKPNKNSSNDKLVLNNTVPLWQIVTNRLLQQETKLTKNKTNEQQEPNEVSYTNVLHIHQQLQNSISPKLSTITKRKTNFLK